MYPMNEPEGLVSAAAEHFDQRGRLVDEKSRALIGPLLDALVAWTRRLHTGKLGSTTGR
jgi:chromate reductase